MSARKLAPSPAEPGRLKPSSFISEHASFIASRISGPIADIACGSGRNLLPFLDQKRRIDCYDIRPDCIDPYVLNNSGNRLKRYTTDLLASNFSLRQNKYSLIFLVHFYHSTVLTQIVQAIKPGGLLVLETVDNRGGNYVELPHIGEIFDLILPLRIITCTAKPTGPNADRQVVKLIAVRRDQLRNVHR